MQTTRIAWAESRIALHSGPPARAGGTPVLYVHGATFGAQLAVFWRFDGQSWADSLGQAGFDVFGLDLLGFGSSDRPLPADGCPSRAADAAGQIGAAVDHIRSRLGVSRVHVIAHSWGTTAAALYATWHPEAIARLVLFAPLTPRAGDATQGEWPAYHLVTPQAQWDRFSGYIPRGETGGMLRRWFDEWAAAYLASDPEATMRTPPAVAVPAGPLADIARLQAGERLYDPAAISVPTLIVRGEWDAWPNDADAQWLLAALKRAPLKRDVKLPRASHVMHLEASRFALYRAVEGFLQGDPETPDER